MTKIMEQETRHKIPCLLPVSLKHMQKMPWYETFDVKRQQACVKFFKKKKNPELENESIP